MIIEKIYMDMDGVLADFDRGLLEICNIEPQDQATKSDEYDDKMWEAVRMAGHYYDMLNPLSDGITVYKALKEKYGDKIEILSAIPKEKRGIVTAGEDKITWAHREVDEDIVVNIVMREEKKNYVKGRGYILIDDLEKNIMEWEANGGTGIRFTNAADVLYKISQIEEM